VLPGCANKQGVAPSRPSAETMAETMKRSRASDRAGSAAEGRAEILRRLTLVV